MVAKNGPLQSDKLRLSGAQASHAQFIESSAEAAAVRRAAIELQAVGVLALAGVFSVLIYVLAFVRPYGLLQYWQQPLLDLQKLAKWLPDGRWELAVALAAQGSLYFVGWQAARRVRSRAGWAVVLGVAVAMGAVLLFLLPFDAADIFDNIMHGRILGLYHQNPFLSVGAQYAGDPFLPYMAWPFAPSAYGPFWEVLAGLTARLAGNGILANVFAFKLLGAFFLAASVGLVAAILRQTAPQRALAGVLLLAWNPVILYETIGHGHNDIVMVFWVLAAARGLLNRRYTLAILALVAGALVKFIPILFLPAAGLIALRDLADNRARLRFLGITAAATAILVVLAYGPFWQGLQTLTIDRRETMLTTSLPAFVWALLQGAGQVGPGNAGTAAKLISEAAAGLTALYALWEGVRAWRDRSWLSFSRSALHVSLFYLLVTCVWYQNWYTVWPLALVALFPPGYELALGQIVGFGGLAKPLVFAPAFLWRKPFPTQVWRELRLGPAVLSVSWVAGLYVTFVAWRTHRGAHATVPLPRRWGS
ncbi:MAG TPA: hypothetical protein VGA61_08100 [Anaerolineae bacterium]